MKYEMPDIRVRIDHDRLINCLFIEGLRSLMGFATNERLRESAMKLESYGSNFRRADLSDDLMLAKLTWKLMSRGQVSQLLSNF